MLFLLGMMNNCISSAVYVTSILKDERIETYFTGLTINVKNLI